MITLDDHIRHVAAKLLRLLSNNKHAIPGLKLLPSTYTALKSLQRIFQYNIAPNPSSHPLQSNKKHRKILPTMTITSFTPLTLIHKHNFQKTEGVPYIRTNMNFQKTEGDNMPSFIQSNAQPNTPFAS